MQENKLRKSILAAMVPIGASLIAASMASAQTVTYTNTVDAAAANSSDLTPNTVLFGSPNFNPPPISDRFDYGGSTPTAIHSTTFSATHDNTGNGGGSIKNSFKFSASSDGSESAAFTMDLFPQANNVTAISFDLMVDPTSTADTSNGYGFFQLFNRDNAYGGFTQLYAEELGNPNFSATNLAGTWEHIVATIPAGGIPVRALTFQDFSDPTRDINGTVSYYIDNLSVTYTVPEPASIGLLGFAVPALLARRRKS